MVLFLGLAGVCFLVVTLLKYVDGEARAEVVDRLAGAQGGAYGYEDGWEREHERRAMFGEEGEGERIEIPSR